MILRIIDGGRRSLEDRVLKHMMEGKVCQEDLDRLRPKGELHLVHADTDKQQEPMHWPPFGDLLG